MIGLAIGIERRQRSAQDIDFLLIEIGAHEDPANSPFELFRMIGTQETAARQNVLEVRMQTLDLGSP